MANFFSNLIGRTAKDRVSVPLFSTSGNGLLADQNPNALDIVISCLRLRSETMATLPLIIKKRNQDGKIAIIDHPVTRLFNYRPNIYQDSYNFKEYIQKSIDVHGNFYAQKIYNGKNQLLELIPLDPTLVTVQLSEGVQIYRYMSHSFNKSEIFHIQGFGGLITGESIIDQLKETLGLYGDSQRHQRNLLKNGATPKSVLESAQPLNKQARESLEQELNNYYSGNNSGRTLVLTNGLQLKPISITSADMELLSTRAFQARTIAGVFGVPAHLIHLDVKSSYASSEQATADFAKFTVTQMANRIESAITNQLLSEQEIQSGLTVQFDLNELLRSTQKERFDSYRTGISTGFLTINEVREKEGYSSVESGDELFIPVNLVKKSSELN